MGGRRRMWLSLMPVAVFCDGASASGDTVLSCSAPETLEIVRSVVTYRANTLQSLTPKDKLSSVKDEALGFGGIATAERTAGHARCTLTAMDTKTGGLLSGLGYGITRTNQKPFVRVYFKGRPDRGYRCNPLMTQALVIPSEMLCE